MSELSFSNFLTTPPGLLLKDWENQIFSSIVSDCFGTYALQIGGIDISTLDENRIQSKWILFDKTPTNLDHSQGILIQGLPEELPFENESMDLVTIPHTIELSQNPQQVLREAVRVLAPEGRIVISSFNSMGMWWMKQQLVSFGFNPYIPSHVVPVPLYRLKDWMKLLGLEIDSGFFGIYQPGFRSTKRLLKWNWINKAGDRWAPQLSNAFILSAVKRTPNIRLIGKPTLTKIADAIRSKPSVPLTQKAENK